MWDVSEPGPPLVYSIMLELLGYLDIVQASESERKFWPFMLDGLKANEE